MIGGNTTINLQVSTTQTNEIGETVRNWKTVCELHGFLDLAGGDSKYSTYDAKIQESTHVFVADYVPLGVKADNCRAIDEGGFVYDVTMIDDPMRLHKHLEIFMKYTG